MTSIELPVSIGEALDKLSILEIKLEKIQDERKNDVQKEYDAIYTKLAHLFTVDAKFHYTCLKNINRNIWENQDKFRATTNNEEKSRICMEVNEQNDRRFHIKAKLNGLFDSALKEQKGYARKTAFFFGHLGLGDLIGCIGMIRYLSTKYDRVRVVCKRQMYKTFQQMLSDDPVIEYYLVDNCYELSLHTTPLERFQEIVGDAHVYLAGQEVIHRQPQIFYLPFCFYFDCNIPVETFWSYFHIASQKEAEELAESVKGIPYAFLHNSSSGGEVFPVSAAERVLNVTRDDVFFINCNENVYSEGHKWYELAQRFVNQPLAFYTHTIAGATYLCLSDSSVLCLALHYASPRTKHRFYVSRSDADYSYFFNDRITLSPMKDAPFEKIPLMIMKQEM